MSYFMWLGIEAEQFHHEIEDDGWVTLYASKPLLFAGLPTDTLYALGALGGRMA